LSTKSKTDTKFSGISFGENYVKSWQTGSKYLTLVGARFTGKYIRPIFHSNKRHIFALHNKKMPLQTLLFVLKFLSNWVRCAEKILEDFTNSRKSQIKP